jgi:hypothetical protein
LRHFRRSDEGRLLWVDAICINQSDSQERGQQVRSMSEIYSRCTANLFWLGEETEDTNRVLEVVKAMADNDIAKFQEWCWNTESDKVEVAEGSLRSDCWMIAHGKVPGLYKFFSEAEILDRTWIVPEVVFAPKVILPSGTHRMDWDIIDRILGGEKDDQRSNGYRFKEDRSHSTLRLLGCFEKSWILNDQRNALRNHGQKEKLGLLDGLAKYSSTRCTDPRDKVFFIALLGLASEESAIGVDYQKSTREVLVNVLE